MFAAEQPSRRLRTAAITAGMAVVVSAVVTGIVIASTSAGPEVASTRSADRTTPVVPTSVVAVPIGAAGDRLAAMTVTGLAVADARDGTIDGRAVVELHGGGRVEARRVWSDQRIVLVSTSPVTPENADDAGWDPLEIRSTDGEVVDVALLGDHPDPLRSRLDRIEAFTEPLEGVDWSSVAEGTPVVDGEGMLIGLCSPHGTGVDLLALSDDAIAATSIDR
ncbi:MAG: hypothetical protein RIR49_1001 [Actinomycetota bacterium]